ncbi:MAG TPA: hypothetical protein VFC07_07900, partial [Verrucomicrobiae bacterium]|nr:hypothetical protein [Verrucomicrobiae bacterium]
GNKRMRARRNFRSNRSDFWYFIQAPYALGGLFGNCYRSSLFGAPNHDRGCGLGRVAFFILYVLSFGPAFPPLATSMSLPWQLDRRIAYLAASCRQRHENYTGIPVALQLRHIILALAAGKMAGYTSAGGIKNTRLLSLAGSNAVAFFQEQRESLPRHIRLRGVRANSGFCLPELLAPIRWRCGVIIMAGPTEFCSSSFPLSLT